MRILVHDYAGHPFQAQLSRELARRGHTVVHSFREKPGGRRGALERVAQDPPGLTFAPIRLGPRASACDGFARRVRHELTYGAALVRVARRVCPDVVISANTPLLVQRRLLSASHAMSAGFVYWMQDLISASQRRRLRRRRRLIGAPAAYGFQRLERSSLVNSDAVVAVTPDFVEVLTEYRVPARRITVIPNWAPLDEVVPAPRANAWATAHGLADRIIFLYAGSLGLKHDPTLLVELADGLPEIAIALVAEGAGADLVQSEAGRRGLSNVFVFPSQPYEHFSEVLASGDVLVALLDQAGGAYSVPSKILTYLCTERPILASVPANNLAAQVVRDSGGGVVVEPGSVDDWVEAARRLAADADLRQRLAQRGDGLRHGHVRHQPDRGPIRRSNQGCARCIA